MRLSVRVYEYTNYLLEKLSVPYYKIINIMKILYVLTLTFLYLSGQGQIPKGTNTIAVDGVGYMEVCKALLDSGYLIGYKDNDLQTAKTEPRDYPKYWDGKFVINVRVKDSIAYFTARFWVGNLFANEPVEYFWKKINPKSMVGVPFFMVDNFAKSFNKPVHYLKR